MRVPRVRITVRRMMVVVAVVAFLSSIVAYHDRARRQARLRSYYLHRASMYSGRARSDARMARSLLESVPVSLRLAAQARQWRPVALDPVAERQALRCEAGAAWSSVAWRYHWASAVYFRQLARDYRAAASRPLEPFPPDPPPPPPPPPDVLVP